MLDGFPSCNTFAVYRHDRSFELLCKSVDFKVARNECKRRAHHDDKANERNDSSFHKTPNDTRAQGVFALIVRILRI